MGGPEGRRTAPYLGDHIRTNVIGCAVCPRSGENFTMILEGVDTDVFQCFLDRRYSAAARLLGLTTIKFLMTRKKVHVGPDFCEMDRTA